MVIPSNGLCSGCEFCLFDTNSFLDHGIIDLIIRRGVKRESVNYGRCSNYINWIKRISYTDLIGRTCWGNRSVHQLRMFHT